MHIGQFIGYGASVLTPWMRRQADNAVFTFEIVDNPDSVTVTFKAYEKNSEEYGTPSTGRSDTWTGTSLKTATASGLKELVRFEIDVSGADESPTGTGIVYRMLEPTWYDTAKTS